VVSWSFLRPPCSGQRVADGARPRQPEPIYSRFPEGAPVHRLRDRRDEPEDVLRLRSNSEPRTPHSALRTPNPELISHKLRATSHRPSVASRTSNPEPRTPNHELVPHRATGHKPRMDFHDVPKSPEKVRYGSPVSFGVLRKSPGEQRLAGAALATSMAARVADSLPSERGLSPCDMRNRIALDKPRRSA